MEYKTGTARHAERELQILSLSATDPDNRPIIEPFAKPYYLDAIIWKDQKGDTYTGSKAILKDGSRLGCAQNIKSFPFTPKTFYIDTYWYETTKDDWEFIVVDETQLEKVWKYYDRKEL